MNSDIGYKADELVATQLMCFTISGATGEPLQLGVDIRLVREVLSFRRITPVPLAPQAVMGIVDWRGHIIPVVDLAGLIGDGKAAHSSRDRLLVIRRQDGFIAFIAREVTGIGRAMGSVDPVPSEMDLHPTLLCGSIRSPLGRVLLLDPEAVRPSAFF